MNVIRWQALAIAALMPLTAAACSKVAASESSYEDPATLTEVEGSDLMQVTFTDRAVERIGIETQVLVDGPDGKVIPYSALLYDPDGTNWVFTQIKPGTFLRVPISVVTVRGEEVILSDGPAAGTEVVSVGVSELYGAEHGLGAH